MNKDTFWDKYGLLHVERGKTSENGILFATEFHYAKSISDNYFDGSLALYAIQSTMRTLHGEDYYEENPLLGLATDDHFSHDNMTALYALARICNQQDLIERLPVIHWNNRPWLHPRDILFYLLMKEISWLQPLLLVLSVVLLLPISYLSCSRRREHTSGKMLVWVRLNALMKSRKKLTSRLAQFFLDICTSKIKDLHGSDGWADVARIYFPDRSHPNHIIFSNIYSV